MGIISFRGGSPMVRHVGSVKRRPIVRAMGRSMEIYDTRSSHRPCHVTTVRWHTIDGTSPSTFSSQTASHRLFYKPLTGRPTSRKIIIKRVSSVES